MDAQGLEVFFGTIVESQRAGAFVLTETRYSPNERLPWHVHRHPFATVVLTGRYRERVLGEIRECERGTLVLHSSGELHADEFARAGGACLNITPDLAWFTTNAWRSGIFKNRIVTRLSLTLYRQFHFHHAFADSLAENLLAAIGAYRIQAPVWLTRVQNIFDERFADRLRMRDIAQTVGVHPTHLARAFRDHYRMTCGDYIRRRRVESAANFLRDHRSIAEVAHRSGFADQSHFTRWFRRLTGLSPTEFRRINEAANSVQDETIAAS